MAIDPRVTLRDDLIQLRSRWEKLEGKGDSVFREITRAIDDLQRVIGCDEPSMTIIRLTKRDKAFDLVNVCSGFLKKAYQLHRQGKKELADIEFDSAWNFMNAAWAMLTKDSMSASQKKERQS